MKTKSNVFFALVASFLALLSGCPNPQVCKIETHQAASPAFPYFGTGDTISVEEYDHISMRPGDTITLAFPCEVSKPTAIPTGFGISTRGNYARLWRSQQSSTPEDSHPKGGGGGQNTAPFGPSNVVVSFTSPQYNFVTYLTPSTSIWPGDANVDGRRNMLDLYPIALGILQFGRHPISAAPCNFQTNPPLSYPPVQGGNYQTDAIYDVCPWGTTFTWNGIPIDFMHADCNLDRKIDEIDADYLMAVLDPMYLPQFLNSPTQNTTLNAAFPSAFGVDPQVRLEPDGHFTLQIPFDINIVNTNGLTAKEIVGLAFERPVAESQQYHLLKTELFLDHSALFAAQPTQTLWRQKFWGDFFIRYLSGSCGGSSDHVLDVGAFRLGDFNPSGASTMYAGLCMVTLDDILRTLLLDPAHAFDLMQHTVNGVVFVNQGGTITAESVNCTSDTSHVTMSSLCANPDVFLRDGIEDDGTTLPTYAKFAGASPDIWVRDANGNLSIEEHQQPIDGTSQFVFVRIFNQSCDTLREAKVQVNWAIANSELKDEDFDGNIVGTTIAPDIPPFNSVIVRMPWTPNLGLVAAPNGCSPMVCLLAQIFAGSDASPGLSSGNILPKIISSNNLAMRSTMAITNGATGAVGEACATIQLKPHANASSLRLKIEQLSGPAALPASHYGDLRITVRGANLTVPANTINMHITQSAPTSIEYTLDPEAIDASLYFGNTIPSGLELDVLYKLRNTGAITPQLTARVPYRFRIYLVDGTTEYSSTIVELVAQ
jgi:hypothetical protein